MGQSGSRDKSPKTDRKRSSSLQPARTTISPTLGKRNTKHDKRDNNDDLWARQRAQERAMAAAGKKVKKVGESSQQKGASNSTQGAAVDKPRSAGQQQRSTSSTNTQIKKSDKAQQTDHHFPNIKQKTTQVIPEIKQESRSNSTPTLQQSTAGMKIEVLTLPRLKLNKRKNRFQEPSISADSSPFDRSEKTAIEFNSMTRLEVYQKVISPEENNPHYSGEASAVEPKKPQKMLQVTDTQKKISTLDRKPHEVFNELQENPRRNEKENTTAKNAKANNLLENGNKKESKTTVSVNKKPENKRSAKDQKKNAARIRDDTNDRFHGNVNWRANYGLNWDQNQQTNFPFDFQQDVWQQGMFPQNYTNDFYGRNFYGNYASDEYYLDDNFDNFGNRPSFRRSQSLNSYQCSREVSPQFNNHRGQGETRGEYVSNDQIARPGTVGIYNQHVQPNSWNSDEWLRDDRNNGSNRSPEHYPRNRNRTPHFSQSSGDKMPKIEKLSIGPKGRLNERKKDDLSMAVTKKNMADKDAEVDSRRPQAGQKNNGGNATKNSPGAFSAGEAKKLKEPQKSSNQQDGTRSRDKEEPNPGSVNKSNTHCPVCCGLIESARYLTLDCNHRLHLNCALEVAPKVKHAICSFCIENEGEGNK